MIGVRIAVAERSEADAQADRETPPAKAPPPSPSPAGTSEASTAETGTDRGAAKAATGETRTDRGAAKAAEPTTADAGADCGTAKAAADSAANHAGTDPALGKRLIRQQGHQHQTHCRQEPKLFHGRLLGARNFRSRASDFKISERGKVSDPWPEKRQGARNGGNSAPSTPPGRTTDARSLPDLWTNCVETAIDPH